MFRDKKFDALMVFIALMALVVIVLIVVVKIKQNADQTIQETETTQVEEQTETDVIPDEEVEEVVEEVGEEEVITMVKTTDLVNVRAEASVNGTKLVTVDAGTLFQLVEQMDNGWTKIIYQNQEAYIKSDYVEVVVPIVP
ncbi:MAG: SH3 domain-containing protein [Clostridiales bacterium]|nr:SH3 domain-containing protein [Clostridiales bacterium]